MHQWYPIVRWVKLPQTRSLVGVETWQWQLGFYEISLDTKSGVWSYAWCYVMWSQRDRGPIITVLGHVGHGVTRSYWGDGLMIKAQDRTELIGQGGLFHSLTYRQSISPGSIVGNSLFKIKICYISWSPFHEKSYVLRQENRFDKSNLGMSNSTKCFWIPIQLKNNYLYE